MATNEVFISYDYDHDKRAKDRLLGWDVNHEFNFTSYDKSLNVELDSNEAADIKQDLAAQIGRSSHFLCLVGKETYRSGWAKWEIQKALELKKKLVAVKPSSINNSPPALQRRDVSWCMMFNFDSIRKAIDTI
jgi:hypothetical protein